MMARFAWFSSALLVFLSTLAACEDWGHPEDGVDKYVTRPDIVSPRWDIKVYDKEAITPGYWFLAPYEKVGERESGGAWVGPAIYDGEGELIWSGSHLWNNINVMDFQVSKVRGEDRLTLMYPLEEDGIVLDQHYQEIDRVPVGIKGKTLDMHELHFVENGNTLLLLKRNMTLATEEESKSVGFEGECRVTFAAFEELDTTTWETKFQWNSGSFIPLNDSTLDTNPVDHRCTGPNWDFLHPNALDKFADGHYLLSARHADALYKIDKDDGHVIWQLGGKFSDFEMGNVNFSRQHHARVREQNETHTIVTLLDNAKGQDPQEPTSEWSRALKIALRTDTDPMTAELVQAYDHPQKGYSYRRGDYQVLSNGNAFICWSEQSLQSEHAPDGRILFEARMQPNWIGTYRAFKQSFVGLPVDPPDVFAQAFDHEEDPTVTLVHVSWNGATEVANWNLYKSTEDGETMTRIASRPREGFETALEYDGYARYVVVEGVDKDGKPLGQSKVFTTVQPKNMSTPAVAAEVEWLQEAKGKQAGVTNDEPEDSAMFIANPIATFFGGVASSFIAMFIVWRVRQRPGTSFWSTPKNLKREMYAPVGQRDAEAYDETKLEGLSGKSNYKERDQEFELDDSDDDDGSVRV